MCHPANKSNLTAIIWFSSKSFQVYSTGIHTASFHVLFKVNIATFISRSFSHGIFYSESLAVSVNYKEIMTDYTFKAHIHMVPLIIQTMQNVLSRTACHFLWKLLFRH